LSVERAQYQLEMAQTATKNVLPPCRALPLAGSAVAMTISRAWSVKAIRPPPMATASSGARQAQKTRAPSASAHHSVLAQISRRELIESGHGGGPPPGTTFMTCSPRPPCS
jgi:hypothetical protein